MLLLLIHAFISHFNRFQRKLKLLLIILLGISTAFGFYFSLAVYGYISGSAVNIFMGLCLQYFFTFATTPLYYEAAVEVTYPVPEGKCTHMSVVYACPGFDVRVAINALVRLS